MKKVSFLTMLLIAFVQLAFAHSKGIHNALPHSKMVSTPTISFTVSQTIPFSFTLIACDGGSVDLEGNLHDLFHVTINGNRIVIKYLDNPQGISGISSTGVKYQATGGTQETVTGSLVNGQFSDTFINNFRIIGQGPYNNYVIHENLHITVNANGTVTAFVDNVTMQCQ